MLPAPNGSASQYVCSAAAPCIKPFTAAHNQFTWQAGSGEAISLPDVTAGCCCSRVSLLSLRPLFRYCCLDFSRTG
jgi:hypothetical protein